MNCCRSCWGRAMGERTICSAVMAGQTGASGSSANGVDDHRMKALVTTIAVCLMGNVDNMTGVVACGAADVGRHLQMFGIGVAEGAAVTGETVTLRDGDRIGAVGGSGQGRRNGMTMVANSLVNI